MTRLESGTTTTHAIHTRKFKGFKMSKYSKAIAAAISGIVGLLTAFGIVTPAITGIFTPETVTLLSGLFVTLLVAFGVFAAPANAES